VLVGQMKTALLEILGKAQPPSILTVSRAHSSLIPVAEKYHPDRIIIESS
jgi:hypothetical protein